MWKIEKLKVESLMLMPYHIERYIPDRFRTIRTGRVRTCTGRPAVCPQR